MGATNGIFFALGVIGFQNNVQTALPYYIYIFKSGKGHFFNVVYMCNIIEKRLKNHFKLRKKVGYRKGAGPNIWIVFLCTVYIDIVSEVEYFR